MSFHHCHDRGDRGDASLKEKEERPSPLSHVESAKIDSKSANVSTATQTKKTPQTQLEVTPYLAYTSTKKPFLRHCPPTPSWPESSQFHKPSLSSLHPLHTPPSNPAGISSMADLKEWHHLGYQCWKWHHLQPAWQRESWWLSHAVTLAHLLEKISTMRALNDKNIFMKHSETWKHTNLIRRKMLRVESSSTADPSFLANPRLFILAPVTPLNWAYDLCSQDLDLLSTSRKLLVTKVQFAAWQHNTSKMPHGGRICLSSVSCKYQGGFAPNSNLWIHCQHIYIHVTYINMNQ